MMCDKCAHSEVCKFKEDYAAARDKLDNVMIAFKNGRSAYLRDIQWLEPVELKCANFLAPQRMTKANYGGISP